MADGVAQPLHRVRALAAAVAGRGGAHADEREPRRWPLSWRPNKKSTVAGLPVRTTTGGPGISGDAAGGSVLRAGQRGQRIGAEPVPTDANHSDLCRAEKLVGRHPGAAARNARL